MRRRLLHRRSMCEVPCHYPEKLVIARLDRATQ
jgi:hypothetical protein